MKNRIKKMLAVLCAVSIIICGISFFPSEAHAVTAGANLEIRVGYWGESSKSGDYRVKATLTRSRLQSLGQYTNKYTNVTNGVGGVCGMLYMVAQGPSLESVISAAGIDINSVQAFHIRTTDGTGAANRYYQPFNASSIINTARYYYPNIYNAWFRDTDFDGTFRSAELKGLSSVGTILATTFYQTKSPSQAKKMNSSMMTTEKTYRLCFGQTQLPAGANGLDYVTSKESAHSIFGIDVQLYGSPPSGNFKVGINLDDPNLKVGSKKTLTAVINGKDFFGDEIKGEITWSSSNEKVATIGRTSGILEVKSKGTAVITATATTSDGKTKSKSVKINTTGKKEKPGDKDKDQGGGGGTTKDNGKKTGDKAGDTTKVDGTGLIGSEVSVSGLDNVVYDRKEMSDDAIALAKEKPDAKVMIWAGVVAAALLLGGIALRTKQYFREV